VLFFFPKIEGIEENKLFDQCRSLLEKKGRKKGYISGTTGPKVMVFAPTRHTPTRTRSKDSFPVFIQELIHECNTMGIFDVVPWQVSINFYQPGDLMVPHKDGTGTLALITTLGSSAILDFYHRPTSTTIKATQVFIKHHSASPSVPSIAHLSNSSLPLNTPSVLEVSPTSVTAPSTTSAHVPDLSPTSVPAHAPSPICVSVPSPVLASYEVADQPTVSVLLVPGSALVITGDAFLHYAHAIEPRMVDEITEKVINLGFFDGKFKVGERVERKERVSVVMWDSERSRST